MEELQGQGAVRLSSTIDSMEHNLQIITFDCETAKFYSPCSQCLLRSLSVVLVDFQQEGWSKIFPFVRISQDPELVLRKPE